MNHVSTPEVLLLKQMNCIYAEKAVSLLFTGTNFFQFLDKHSTTWNTKKTKDA